MKLKGEGISIAGREATQNKHPPLNKRFALTFDRISLEKSVEVKFKIQRLNGCVGFGMFLKNVIQSKNF